MLFIFVRPAGRDDTEAVAALSVGDVEDFAAVAAEQDTSLFDTVVAQVDPLDGEGIDARRRGLLEADAVGVEIVRGLGIVPPEAGL